MDLSVASGTTTVVIGPSGCGKSTLLRLINGLLLSDAGEISVFGQVLSANVDWRALRLRMGYVIQEGGLFPHLTARENVALMPNRLGWSGDRLARRTAELTELVCLQPDLLDRYPAQLSGGQRQRVSLMRALVLEPELLLLDEPLGALDPMIRYALQQDLRGLFANERFGVVMVTHDLHEAEFFGDEIVLMDAGQVVQRGPFSDLIESPANEFVRRFVEAQHQSVRA